MPARHGASPTATPSERRRPEDSSLIERRRTRIRRATASPAGGRRRGAPPATALRGAPDPVEAAQLAAQRELHIPKHALDEQLAMRAAQRGQIRDIEQQAAQRCAVAGGTVDLLLHTLSQRALREELDRTPQGGLGVTDLARDHAVCGGEGNHCPINASLRAGLTRAPAASPLPRVAQAARSLRGGSSGSTSQPRIRSTSGALSASSSSIASRMCCSPAAMSPDFRSASPRLPRVRPSRWPSPSLRKIVRACLKFAIAWLWSPWSLYTVARLLRVSPSPRRSRSRQIARSCW